MTTDPLKQLIESVQSMHLTNQERSAMRNNLVNLTYTYQPRSGFSAVFARHAFAYVFAILALLVGGTTALAQWSLPNDFLYPLKTQVNDRVAIAVVGDQDARIEKELEQIGWALNQEDAVADHELRDDADVRVEVTSEPTTLEFHDDAEVDLQSIGAEIDASLAITPEPIE